MKVRIIKGTNQIGGCITEIISNQGTKIIIDYGDNLNDEEQLIIPGLTKKDDLKPSYDGVVITHSHKDHIGCAPLIKQEIPIYLNKEGKEIHNNLCYFTKEYKKILREEKNTLIYFEFENPFWIKDIKVTPFIADHSNYNSAMLLIEADGQKILHTGDYRNHGKKGCLFSKVLNQIGKVDLLITEGTTIGSKDRVFKKEIDLSKDFQKLVNYDQIYVMCSSTNIDRIVNLYKSFSKTHKIIMDMCMNSTTSLLKNIPNSNTFRNVYTFVSPNQKKIDEPYGRLIRHTRKVIDELPFSEKFVLSVKPSMIDYFKENSQKIKNACIIYSMWDGYIKEDWAYPGQRDFKNYLENDLHMDFYILHTSGHASLDAIKTLDEKVRPNKVIIIHTEKNEEAQKIEKEIFKNRLVDVKDGDIIELKGDKRMKIEKYNLKKLRKDYDQNHDLVIRIREQSKEKYKKECKDIIYSEGIKAFFVENKECDENSVSIKIPENIYKLNQTCIRNVANQVGNVEHIEDFLESEENKTFIKDQASLKKGLETYFKNIIIGGTFRFGSVYFNGTKKLGVSEIKKQVIQRLEQLNEKLKEIGTYFNLQETLDQLDTVNDPKSTIAFTLANTQQLSVEDLTKVEELIILYTTFQIKDKKLTSTSHSGFALPFFSYDKQASSIDSKDIAEFNASIQNAILKYETNTKVELEKKYQHSFMIENKLKNYLKLSSVVPFEEECYTQEKDDEKEESSDDRGRIDCIFIDPKEKQSDIHLIELKVNEGVVGSKDDLDDHGINTHLVDIHQLITDQDQYSVFIRDVVNRYNYRNELLENDRISISEDCNLYYWIILAINGKDYEDEQQHAKAVWEKVKELQDDRYIKGLKAINLLDENSGECSFQICNGKNCKIKLLFNVWNSKGKLSDREFLTIKEFKKYYEIEDPVVQSI